LALTRYNKRVIIGKLDPRALFKCKRGREPMTHPYSKLREILIANKRIKELETLLAGGIQSVADLLKENLKLEKELEEIKKQRDCWQKLYRKIKPDEKVPCDRSKAMVVYSEIDISEVLHR